MKTSYTIQLRAFPVRLQSKSTGEIHEESIILTKHQLQAAQVVGQSSKELICRTCDRAGFSVLEVGKAVKRDTVLDLEQLYSGAAGNE